jgi:hypothetical protein
VDWLIKAHEKSLDEQKRIIERIADLTDNQTTMIEHMKDTRGRRFCRALTC